LIFSIYLGMPENVNAYSDDLLRQECSLFETVSMKGFTPKICGQFVDRILSTAQ
jgi:hypothetical protein